MKQKAISLMLCAAMILTMMQGFTIDVFAAAKEGSGYEPTLAYIPMDNRPVNVDRVIYEAGSAGFKVAMPDEDLYTTRLDGQPLNTNGTQYGDREKLLDWMLKMDKVTDYFVISLDQVLSGGLVNSRALHNKSYEDEYKIIDAIAELSKENHVYLIDTVPRLASCTVGYQGASLETYNFLRQYSSTPRTKLQGGALTADRIVAGYPRDNYGKLIPVSVLHLDEVNNSLLSRERKLRLTDYMLTKDCYGKAKYFIGVDDSSSKNTIQTNEVEFINLKMGNRGLIYSGADELGMMAVLSLMIDYYGYQVNASAEYFGDSERSSSGSIFDMETVNENVEQHLKSIGVRLVDKKKADLDIVVLTPPSKDLMDSKYISRMIDYINQNIAGGIPTIVINSAPGAYSGNFEYRMTRECEMSMLLSYSSWGTVGNSIGLALCNGISRYLYLHSRNDSSNEADIAFLKGLIFSYEKDISYLRGGGIDLFNSYLKLKGWSESNFYRSDRQTKFVNADLERMLKASEYNITVGDITDNMTDCRYLKGLGGECGMIGSIGLSNYSAPFFRSNEIRFDIDVDLSDKVINGNDGAGAVPGDTAAPSVPVDNQQTYPVTLYYKDEAGNLQELSCFYDKATGSIRTDVGSLTGIVPEAFNPEPEEESLNPSFTDVPASAWFYDPVMYVYERGMMQGMTASTFAPGSPMSRSMLVYTLYSMEGKPEAGSRAGTPPDVENGWYKPAVDWALANRIVSGYGSGNFGPDDPVNREQLANILWRYAKYKGMDVSNGAYPVVKDYKDAKDVSTGLCTGLDWASSNGIITGAGSGTKLMPRALASRAEVAAVLERFVK